ncbi:MAG: hypothetical protein LVQ97_02230 [Candidatus Micrarchaeales archaeon]|jgi:hypothetical protein|nr:hypothetical protein [Candidatus Micrarchaeales archaeon]
MKLKAKLYSIVLVQLAIAVIMWYISADDPIGYQQAWAAMFGAELILVSVILYGAMKQFMR